MKVTLTLMEKFPASGLTSYLWSVSWVLQGHLAQFVLAFGAERHLAHRNGMY